VLVEHLGKSPGILDTRAPKQVKSKQYLPQHRNGVLEKLDDKDGLSITPLLNCETAVAALGFLLRHTCSIREKSCVIPERGNRGPAFMQLCDHGQQLAGQMILSDESVY